MTPKENGSGEFRGETNARLRNLEKQIDTILTNHFPHMQSSIESIENKLDEHIQSESRWQIGIMTSLVLVLLGLVIDILSR